ncbi:MAG: hypothetical protein SOZ62_06015 [Eubacteriales bacterium]|nr:hypothetical protein [Eubacteriales bacterium]
MQYSLIDERMSHNCIHSLIAEEIMPIKLPPFSRLAPPVASHPDMLLFIRKNTLFTSTQYYNEAKDVFNLIERVSNVEIITDDTDVCADYPMDISFNCFDCMGYLFGFKKHLSKNIIENSVNIANVKQGYSSCSTVCVDENSIITADKSIAKKAQQLGADVCLISEGGVKLPPYEYGFIGGACGVSGNSVYFTGNLDIHPCAKQIREFIDNRGKKVISLSDDILFDYGKILFLP